MTDIKKEITDLLQNFHKDCLSVPFNDEPLARKIRKEFYADLIIDKAIKQRDLEIVEMIEGEKLSCGAKHWEAACDCAGINQTLNDLQEKLNEQK